MQEDSGHRFDPNAYMTSISGNAYLPVAARLAWFRNTYPHGTIDMEMLGLDFVTLPQNQGGGQTERAIFKAKVSDGEGGHAVGYGSETQYDFRDHIEKASTKALGRALAAMGFGTMESGNEYSGEAQAGRVVDAPVAPRGAGVPNAQNGQINSQHGGSGVPVQNRPQGAPATAQRAQGQGFQGGGPRPVQQQGQGGNYGQAVQQQQARPQQQGQGGGAPAIQNPDAPASQNQIKYVMDLLGGMGYDPNAFDWSGLTKGEASHYIEVFKSGQLPEDILQALAEVGQGVTS